MKLVVASLLGVACAAPTPGAPPPAELPVAPIATAPATATATTTVTMTAPGADAGDAREIGTVHDADKVVAALRVPFRNCYQDGLRRDPKMQGRVVVTIVVGESGVVENARLASNSGLAEDVAACIRDVLFNARFASPGPGKKATLQVPVSFVVAAKDGGAPAPGGAP